jgi:exonuclease V gamma subunit
MLYVVVKKFPKGFDMALKIISRTKIEDLADLLISTIYNKVAMHDPFLERQIIVPNKNIEKWLRLRIAQNQGVCAGVEFPFFDNFLFNTLAKLVDTSKSFKQISEADLQLQIANIILSDDSEMLSPLRDYVFGKDSSKEINQTRTARKLWQLSGKLANYIREYEFRRPDYINAFLSNDWIKNTKAILFEKNANKEALVLAQAYLCRKLFMEIYSDKNDTLSLRQLLNLATKANPSKEKKTLYFFGLSTFSPIHANALHLLAQHCDVEFYHINVCMEYWGDSENPWEKLKRCKLNEENGQLFDNDEAIIDNELLNAWGSAGRETMKLLVDLEESGSNVEYIYEKDFDSNCESILAALQNGIITRTSDSYEKLPQDSSIQILACPDQKREIETIYNSILDTVLSNKSLDKSSLISTPTPRTDISLSDFAILVPNMAKYRPIIETVFNSRGELPYGLLDSSASAENHYLRGVMELLTIAQFHYTRSSMVSLLSNPCVMKNWNYSDDELAVWIEYIDKLGIHHHYSHEGLTEDGLISGDEFTWEYALTRLRLGLITTDEDNANPIPLYTTNNMYKERIEKLSALIETIYCATKPFKNEELSISEWIETLRSATENILGSNDARIQANVEAALSSLKNCFNDNNKFHSAFILEYLKDRLSNIACNRGSFLTSGITIAALQPMRPIPFKYIYVVGLGEGEFPGNNQESTLDIRALKRMLGDTSFASRNLYLFLETVMSAREKLILSYVAKDTKKDIDKYPSSVIKQLERFLNRFILEKEFEEFNVPLQEYLTPQQTGEAFSNLTANYNNFIAIGKNISASDNYKPTIQRELASYAKLQDKLARSIDNIKPDFYELVKNQFSLDQHNEVFYWNESVLADFLKNARQAILKHRYRVASQTEEIDITKDTTPQSITDEDSFIESSIKRSLFNEALEPIKHNRYQIQNNEIAEQIIRENYRWRQKTSLSPVGIVGEYDLNILLSKILGQDYDKRKNEQTIFGTMADCLTYDLTDGEWISFNIGKTKSTQEKINDGIKEINLPPLVYDRKIDGVNTSIVLSTTLDNIYKHENTLVYICTYKHDGEKSLFLNYTMLRPLLSLVMYIAADNNINENDIYTLCIRAANPKNDENKFTEKSHYIILNKREAIKYIEILIDDLLNPASLVHNYIYYPLKKSLESIFKNNIPENDDAFVERIKSKDVEFIEGLENNEANDFNERPFNISNPPMGEEAIEELFPTESVVDDEDLNRIINIIMSRYYIPIVRQIMTNNE